MSISTHASPAPLDFGPLSRGWKERKKFDLAHALEGYTANGYEDEFGLPPLVEVDHLGVRIRNLTHLNGQQLAELTTNVDRIYSQIMTEA